MNSNDQLTLDLGATDFSSLSNVSLPALTLSDLTAIPSSTTYTYPNVYGNIKIQSSSATSATWTGTSATWTNGYSNTVVAPLTVSNGYGITVKGDADISGNLKVKGRDITELFEKIEERLAILHPNHELEERWSELRELREKYIALEKDILEKEKIWDILQK